MSVEHNLINKPIERLKGNREPLDVQLLDNNRDPLDLTGTTLVCNWYNIQAATQKVTNGAVTIRDATTGKVRYLPASIDVDTVGRFSVFFVITSITPNEEIPWDGARYTVDVIERWQAQYPG
jgi:hypothetical protein